MTIAGGDKNKSPKEYYAKYIGLQRTASPRSLWQVLSESLFSETPSEIGVWAQFMVPILLDSVPIKSDSQG